MYLSAVLTAVTLSVCLASCGDDEDGGGGSGSSTVIVDGKQYTMNYGWWEVRGKRLMLEFSNVNVYGPEHSINRYQELTLDISNWQHSDVQPGTYTAAMEFDAQIYDSSKDELTEHETDVAGNVEVTIAKDGDNYIVTVPETNVRLYDFNDKVTGTVPFSFKYVGKLSVSPERQ